MDQSNIERFYDYYDRIADRLYREYKKPYLEGMNEAFNLLLDDEMKDEYKEEDINDFISWKQEIVDVEFSREDIRRSVQIGMLKGYKHTYSTNALITPDTMGMIIAYFIQKLYKEQPQTIFDPLVGSGNLVYTIANVLKQDIMVYGVDNDFLKCQLSRNLGDLMDIENAMFFQDTFTYYHQHMDVIVTDMMLHNDGTYMPYQVLNHHIDALRENGYLFAIIENDFFEQEGANIFRQEIQKKGQIFGLISLDKRLFSNRPKSILILRKKIQETNEQNDFLLIEMPPFTDQDGMENTLQQVDQWIAARKDVKA
ncbi:class I SAM-dependent methyltransferase [Candidatus Xianfuyuplasma coldseepsis]|uniref:DNA methylase adenine-specific domain-containing protein n=1 Tax=Candidatus Xianfuyuplasma coldseepsis TaxID=2782163 RepID=A0A7L7KQA4_9MOLU|nr:N-6 DNA methylase [Xianfuyuplasma coldseepsis]QMS84765.1 hypothetical protein G4Z02_03010 [Xianfuyuplasma coldseepsis]